MLTVEGAKRLAYEYYEKGGDVLVECWEDSEIQELLDEHKDKAKEKLLWLFKLWKDQRDDIQGW